MQPLSRARRPGPVPRPGSRSAGRGKVDAEYAARPRLALDGDPSLHRLDEAARNRQTEPSALDGRPAWNPVEGLEDPLKVARGDPEPGVADLDGHAARGG